MSGLILLTFLFACNNKKVSKKEDYFYTFSSRTGDTTRLMQPIRLDVASLDTVMSCIFSEFVFKGKVTKLGIKHPQVDGQTEFYDTPDLGVIYTRSSTWSTFTRLHSTSDSIEKRINDYLGHILSRTDLVSAKNYTIIEMGNGLSKILTK